MWMRPSQRGESGTSSDGGRERWPEAGHTHGPLPRRARGASGSRASCMAGPLSGGSERPASSGPHDPVVPPALEPSAPLPFMAVLGLFSHLRLLQETRGEGTPPCPPWHVSKVQLSFGLRWNLLKSVQTLPFKLRLHPRPVATGRRAVCCWLPGAGMEPRALGTLPAETLWRRDRRILSHRAWMMLSASRRPGGGLRPVLRNRPLQSRKIKRAEEVLPGAWRRGLARFPASPS